MAFLIISIPFCIAEDFPLALPKPELIKNTPVTTIYLYAGDKLVASKGSGGIQYYHSDMLGSARRITDQNANKIGETKTVPFGKEMQNTNDARFAYTGKEQDGELYYFGTRYSDPDKGRFLSVYPVPENQDYIYVNNNPMNLKMIL